MQADMIVPKDIIYNINKIGKIIWKLHFEIKRLLQSLAKLRIQILSIMLEVNRIITDILTNRNLCMKIRILYKRNHTVFQNVNTIKPQYINIKLGNYFYDEIK